MAATALPNGGRYGMVAGFLASSQSVFLIGGRTASNANGVAEVMEYNVDTNAYTIHSSITDNLRIASQSYTQIDSTLYIYSSSTDYIVTYDMSTATYTAQYAAKRNASLIEPCVTSDGSEFLFILGGNISPNYESGFHIFDLNTQQWSNDGPNMSEPRIYFSCNTHRSHIYVMGGSNAAEILDTVIAIDISNMGNINQRNWFALDDTLSVKRNQLQSVIHEDDIYVVGGWSGNALATVYGEVDAIDTITNTIRLAGVLTTEGYGVSVVVGVNRLFVFGGYNTVDGELDVMFYTETVRKPPPLPTKAPTLNPTIDPTSSPSEDPTGNPTKYPSVSPSKDPTHNPTMYPSNDPTIGPTSYPTSSPTKNPTVNPTVSLITTIVGTIENVNEDRSSSECFVFSILITLINVFTVCLLSI
eukprot:494542_1